MIGAYALGMIVYVCGVSAIGAVTASVDVLLFIRDRWIVPLLVIAPLFLAYVAARVFGKPRLVVGDDGVRIRGGFRPGLFRFTKLASAAVERGAPGIVLRNRDGSVRVLRTWGHGNERIRGVVARIEASVARVEKDDSSIVSLLARGSRSIGEWRSWLHNASNATGGFRDVVLPSDALERVLATSGANAEARVGAALALRDHVGKSEVANVQKRIRIAAEASADPKVRLVLEAAAADAIDDEALAMTLRRTMERP